MKNRTFRKNLSKAAVILLLVCMAGSVLAGCSEPEKKAESTSGSASLSMEEFYAQARGCDYLI